LISDAQQRHPVLATIDQHTVFTIAKKILILAKFNKVPALKFYLPLLEDSKTEDDPLPGYKKGC
jgi:hypothetical protein